MAKIQAKSLQIRNYSDQDFSRMYDLWRLVAEKKSEWWVKEPQHLKIKLQRPGYSPELDLFVVSLGNQGLVGFGEIVVESRIKRGVFDGFLLPEYRQMGLGTRLLDRALQQCRQHGIQLVHVCVPEGDSGARAFLSATGFEHVRCYQELECDISRRSEIPPELENTRLGCFAKGEETRLAEVQNKVFFGTWGFCPNTVDEIKYYLALTRSSVMDVLLIEEEGKVIGYLWPHVLFRNDIPDGAGQARIHMYGILPEFQCQGWGKRLLLSGFHHFQKKGISTLSLTVDEHNTSARKLYTSLGFKVKTRKLWFQLDL